MKPIYYTSEQAYQCASMIADTAQRHYKAHGKEPSWIYVSKEFTEMIGAEYLPMGALVIHGIVCVRNSRIKGVACYSVNAREGMTL